ncbi:MAG: TraC family protein [Tepidisphaeraceae bacterium]
MRFKRKPRPDTAQVQAQIEKKSAQDWLPFKDIVSNAIHKRDGSMVAVLRVDPMNISLKSDHEKQRIISAVHEAINGQREPIQIICLPRALDLDQYLSSLNDRLKNTTDNLKRRLLAEYVRYVAGLVTEGDVLERRYYILLEQKPGAGKRQNQREELQKRCYEFAGSLGASGLLVRMCGDPEIIDLLFSFLAPRQAAYESAPDGLATVPRVVS